jgi:CRISPR system Cascade subunit CasB
LTAEELRSKAEEFLRALSEMDTGSRAELKRGAGQKLGDAGGGALAAFYRALPYGVGQWLEGRFFTVACLSCLWKTEEAKAAGKSFESCLKQVRLQGYESFDTRVRALLDTDWSDDDGYLAAKLARVAKQMRQKGLQPDFAGLLVDLAYWNNERRSVQRKWARTYWGENEHGVNERKNENSQEEETEDAL